MSKYKLTQPILYSFAPLEPSASNKNGSYSASKVSGKDSQNFGEKDWRKYDENDAKKQSAQSKNTKPVAPPVPPKTKAASKQPIVSLSLTKHEQTTKSDNSSVLPIPIANGHLQTLDERPSRSATDFSTTSAKSSSRSRSRSKTRDTLKESKFSANNKEITVVPILKETSFIPTVQASTQSLSLKQSVASQNGKANVPIANAKESNSSPTLKVSPAIPVLKEFTPTLQVSSQVTNRTPEKSHKSKPKSASIVTQNLTESSFKQNGDSKVAAFHSKAMKRSRSLPRFETELQMKEQAEPIVMVANPMYHYECSAFNSQDHSAAFSVSSALATQECRQQLHLATTHVQSEQLQPAVSYRAAPPPEYLKVRGVMGKKYQHGSGSLKLIRRRKAAEAAMNTSVSLYDPSCSSLSAGKKSIGSSSNGTLSMSRLPIYNRFRTDPLYEKVGTATWRPKLEEKRATTFGMYEYAEMQL